MVKHSHEHIEYFIASIPSGYKALLLYIRSGMNQNKTTFITNNESLKNSCDLYRIYIHPFSICWIIWNSIKLLVSSKKGSFNPSLRFSIFLISE